MLDDDYQKLRDELESARLREPTTEGIDEICRCRIELDSAFINLPDDTAHTEQVRAEQGDEAADYLLRLAYTRQRKTALNRAWTVLTAHRARREIAKEQLKPRDY